MLDVIIISPEYVKKELDLDSLPIEAYIHKPCNIKCPHLEFNNLNQASCTIHGYSWYKNTPCFNHGQIENNKDCKCRIGNGIKTGQLQWSQEKYIYG